MPSSITKLLPIYHSPLGDDRVPPLTMASAQTRRAEPLRGQIVKKEIEILRQDPLFLCAPSICPRLSSLSVRSPQPTKYVLCLMRRVSSRAIIPAWKRCPAGKHGRKEDWHDASVHGHTQEPGRADRRSGCGSSREGHRDPR